MRSTLVASESQAADKVWVIGLVLFLLGGCRRQDRVMAIGRQRSQGPPQRKEAIGAKNAKALAALIAD